MGDHWGERAELTNEMMDIRAASSSQDLGFRVLGLGFMIWGLGFMI